MRSSAGGAFGGDHLGRGHRADADRRVAGQQRFDLAQLDAVAAQLDLGVEAAAELEQAAGADARQVAGEVEAVARPLSERVGHELFGGEDRPPPITHRQARAADSQLADRAPRRGMAEPVEQEDVGVVDRPADRHRNHLVAQALHGVDRGVGRSLGRAVAVEHLAHRAGPAGDRAHRVGLELLAADVAPPAGRRRSPASAARKGGRARW